ncbi:hypothetical protein QBC45DRAFT_485708 [Copromyces sp. CBS 386.78]|nr:hypothetical protein QBC45DRAFT_485708 [Copromyces sp. CBS 386.78]
MSFTYYTPPQLPLGMAQEHEVPNGNKSPRELHVDKDGKVDIMSKLLAYLDRERRQAISNANTVPPATPGLDTSNSTNNIESHGIEEDENVDIMSNLLNYLDREKKKAILHAAAVYPSPTTPATPDASNHKSRSANFTPRKHEPKNPLPKTPTRKPLAEPISPTQVHVPLCDRGLFMFSPLIAAASPASTAASSSLTILDASPVIHQPGQQAAPVAYYHPVWVQEQIQAQAQAQAQGDARQKQWRVEETELLVQHEGLSEEEVRMEEAERERRWLRRLEEAMRAEQAADMEAVRQYEEEEEEDEERCWIRRAEEEWRAEQYEAARRHEEEEEEERRWIREAEDHMLAKQAAEEMRAAEHAAKQPEARERGQRRERKQEAHRAASSRAQQVEAKSGQEQEKETRSLSSVKSSSSTTPAPPPALLLRLSMSPSPVKTRTSRSFRVPSQHKARDAPGDTPETPEREPSPASTKTSGTWTNNRKTKGKLSKELKALAEHSGGQGGQGNVVGVIGNGNGKRKRGGGVEGDEEEHEHVDMRPKKTKARTANIKSASVSTRNVWNGRLRSRSTSTEKEGLEENQHPVIAEKDLEKEKTGERKMVKMKVSPAALARILGSR